MEATAAPRPRLTFGPEIEKLAAALVQFQAEVSAVAKTKTAEVRSDKGNYKYAYADLADVIETTRAARQKAGLAVVQFPTGDGRAVTVVTRVLHTSGQWMEAELTLCPRDDKPQTIGSLITYLRRYAYSAALGICTEVDDDGVAASQGDGHGQRRAARAPATPPANANGASKSVAGTAPPSGDRPTADLLNEIVAMLKGLGWPKPHISQWLQKHAGVQTVGALTAAQANEVRGLLSDALDKQAAEASAGGAS